MKILVGLGNPGPQYERTRHNAGFRVIDQIATASGAQFTRAKNVEALCAKAQVNGIAIWLFKPMTYMNLSGRAVLPFLHYFKLALEEMLVIHDDVSMPLGRMRLQKGGGAGGQHGVESIIEVSGGEKDFHRLKVGVGPDPGGDRRADYVLSGVEAADRDLFEAVISKCAEAAGMWVEKGMQPCMNTYNGVVLGLPERLRLEQEERERKRQEQERQLESSNEKHSQEGDPHLRHATQDLDSIKD